MALSKEYLDSLPPTIRNMLQDQDQGIPDESNFRLTDDNLTQGLQGALTRRFGTSGDFDQEYDASVRGLIGQLPGARAAFDTRRQQIGEDFTNQADTLGRQNEQSLGAHTNRMANNGMGYSGANLLGRSRIGESYQRGVQTLGTNRARQLSGLAGEQNDLYSRIQTRLNEVQGGAAERARVRDETRAWQAEQQKIEQERLSLEQQNAEFARKQAEADRQANEDAIRRIEQQVLQMQQPQPTPSGRLVPPVTTGLNRAGAPAMGAAPRLPTSYPTSFASPYLDPRKVPLF